MKSLQLRIASVVIVLIGLIGLTTGHLVSFGARGVAHSSDLFTPYMSFGALLLGISGIICSYWQTTANKKLLITFRAIAAIAFCFLWGPVVLKLTGTAG